MEQIKQRNIVVNNFKNLLRRNLSARLSWSSIFVVVVTLLIVGSGLIVIASKALESTTLKLQRENAQKVSTLIANYIEHATHDLFFIENLQVMGPHDPVSQQKALDNLIMYRSSFFSKITVIDRNGQETAIASLYHSYLPGEYRNVSTTEAFILAMSRKQYVSPLFVSPESGLLSMQVGLRMGNIKSYFVLLAEINMTSLWQEISHVRIGETGYAYFVNSSGKFLASQQPSDVLQNYGRDLKNMPPVTAFMKGKNEADFKATYRGLNNSNVIGVFSKIPNTDWAVITEYPVIEAKRSIHNMTLYLLIFLFTGSAIAGTIGFMISRRIVGHVNTLTEAAKTMRDGNLDISISDQAGYEELMILASTLNSMRAELKKLYKEKDAQVAELMEIEEALRKSEHELRLSHDQLEQRVQERTKELEFFSYSISHDLRAPLRHINGYAGILAEEYGNKLDDEGHRLLDVVQNKASLMGTLIDELLRFSRVGRQELKRIPVNMTSMAQTIAAQLLNDNSDRSITFRIAELPEAYGDPILLNQVWVNLIGNAVKFTKHCKEARIEIGGQKQNGETSYYIKDNGAGFDKQYAEKIFGVFQRLHNNDEFEGTGVGLALVQRIIVRHGGRVWAEGKVKEGATIFFVLPQQNENLSLKNSFVNNDV